MDFTMDACGQVVRSGVRRTTEAGAGAEAGAADGRARGRDGALPAPRPS
ncbi:hypothetical protein AB0O64_17690 [Streptomyces sp. NPDC088341]